jgi:phosphopantetheinyl transferase (holo-ACP synthase)
VDLLGSGNIGRYKDWRFIERVFTSSEQKRISDYPCPDGMLWALWAGKEAAYKVVKKLFPEMPFSPRTYEVDLYGCGYSGEKDGVSKGGRYFKGSAGTPKWFIDIEVIITSDFIHCLGVYGEPRGGKTIIWGIDNIYQKQQTGNCNDESLLVREAARKSIASYLNCNPERIEIRRKQKMSNLGPPFVYFDGKPAEIDVTLSHDGRYVAYAFTGFN